MPFGDQFIFYTRNSSTKLLTVGAQTISCNYMAVNFKLILFIFYEGKFNDPLQSNRWESSNNCMRENVWMC